MPGKQQPRSLAHQVAIWAAVFVGRRVIRRKIDQMLEDVLHVERPKHRARKLGLVAGVTAVAAAAGAAVWFGRARS